MSSLAVATVVIALSGSANRPSPTGPHTMPASSADAATTLESYSGGALLRRAVFLAFFGFTLVILNGVVDEAALDVSLLPRLLALLVFLLVAVGVVALPAVSRLLDISVLGEPIILLGAGLLLVTATSLVFAVNVSAGLTDVFRTLATFLTLCLACLLLPIVPRWPELLLKIFVAAGLCAALVGGYEIGMELGVGIHGRRAMEQIEGMMSSVNLYAGMLALLLPWCLCGVVLLRAAWRGLAAVASISVLALIIQLQSRAAWLAVLAGAGVALLVVVGQHSLFGLSRRARAILIATVLGGLALLAIGIAIAPADNVFALRVRSMFVAPTDPDAMPREGGRLMIWGITSRMIADHPLTGVGAGNFTIRLPEYFGDDDLDFSNVHTNWMQPHNDFLWVFAEKGLLGIALFMGCFVAAFSSIRALLRSGAAPTVLWITLAALMELVTYLTLSVWDFPLERISHQVSLAVLLAVVTVIHHSLRPAVGGPMAQDRMRIGRVVVVPLAVVALGLGIAYTAAAVRQEKAVIQARLAWSRGQWEEVLAAARLGTTPWKTLDPLACPIAFLEGMAEVRLGRVPEGIACLERARTHNPNRMYVVNNLGILYAGTGRFDEAIECFNTTAIRYPHRIEPFNNLASCLIETGRYAEAVDLLEQIPEDMRNDAIRRNLALASEQAAAEPTAPEDQAEESTESLP